MPFCALAVCRSAYRWFQHQPIQDFNPTMYGIVFYCGDREHRAAVKLERLDTELPIPELCRRPECADTDGILMKSLTVV